MSADEALGLVYLPFGTPTNDFYGGHRPGANLFAESIVAVDARTGERKWHFQAVHHGVWDYDLPAPPALADITVDGRRIQALAQVSKQGFTYVLDRRTGVPVWPIEERPVPQSTAPGERSSPTQPFPVEAAGLRAAGPWRRRPHRLHARAAAAGARGAEALRSRAAVHAALGTRHGPAAGLGRRRQLGRRRASIPRPSGLFVPSLTSPTLVQLVKPDPEKSNFQLRRGGLMVAPSIDGLPVTKPPYGRVTALDLRQGTIAWMAPMGDGPRNHPHIAHLNLPPLGMETRGNPLVTRTLLFVAQGGGNVGAAPPAAGSGIKLPPPETRKLYAFDKATGRQIWATAPPIAGPMARADDLSTPGTAVRGRG